MRPVGAGRWQVLRIAGPAGELHGLDVDGLLAAGARTVGPTLVVCEVTVPALVLGSTQPESDVDIEAARRLGIDVVRRRGGGGAVLLRPGETVWVDAVVPAGDPCWRDDLALSMTWAGEVWAEALGTSTGVQLTVEPPGAERVRAERGSRSLGSVVCFAALGAGEVSVAGRKVVGLSQRRTRRWARIQGLAVRRWPDPELGLVLGPGLSSVGVTLGDIDDLAVGLDELSPPRAGIDAVLDALVSAFALR